MDAAEMQCAAAKTKGRFYTWTTAAALLEELPVGRHVAMKQTAPPIESVEPLAGAALAARGPGERMDAQEAQRNGIIPKHRGNFREVSRD